MAASNRYFNVGACTFNPGTSVTFTGVQSVTITKGIQLEPRKGGLDVYNTEICVAARSPSITIEFDSINKQTALGTTAGTLTVVIPDSSNGASGTGAITATMTLAVPSQDQISAGHARYGTSSQTWIAKTSDGTTNPLSFSEAA